MFSIAFINNIISQPSAGKSSSLYNVVSISLFSFFAGGVVILAGVAFFDGATFVGAAGSDDLTSSRALGPQLGVGGGRASFT